MWAYWSLFPNRCRFWDPPLDRLRSHLCGWRLPRQAAVAHSALHVGRSTLGILDPRWWEAVSGFWCGTYRNLLPYSKWLWGEWMYWRTFQCDNYFSKYCTSAKTWNIQKRDFHICENSVFTNDQIFRDTFIPLANYLPFWCSTEFSAWNTVTSWKV